MFKVHKTDWVLGQKAEGEASEVPHLSPAASPFQLENHLRAALIIALVAQTVEGKGASDQNKPACPPVSTSHFGFPSTLHLPKARCSSRPEYSMNHSQLQPSPAFTAQAKWIKICISNIFYLHPKYTSAHRLDSFL